MNEEFVELLVEHDIGLVIADTAGKWPFMEDKGLVVFSKGLVVSSKGLVVSLKD